MFELYLSDLTKEAQERLLRFWGMKDSSDGNFDVFPIHVFYEGR